MQLIQFFKKLVRGLRSQVHGDATLQHAARFALCVAVALVCLGAVDWSADSPWLLQDPASGQQFRLGQRLEELKLPPGALEQEMNILEEGLLLRQRDGVVVNLTVLKGPWKVFCGAELVGVSGTRLGEWQASLGQPRALYAHAEKVGVMHYYRAAMADIALMVANDEVHSVMLVEPGRLEPALERTGYSPLPMRQ
jgi:hypothetical protein